MKKFLFSNKCFTQLQQLARNNSFRELFSYLLTGGATTLINYAVYLTLLRTGANYLAANTIAWIFAVSFAYAANRIFVFRSGNQIGKELFSFVSMRFFTLITENLLLAFFIQTCEFQPLLSKIAVSFVTVAANYVICKCRIFQKPAPAALVSAENREFLNTDIAVQCLNATTALPSADPRKGENIHE